MGEIICKSGTWNGGISKDFKINPLQMSSVCSIAKGLLFTLTQWQLSEHVFIEHIWGPQQSPRCCGRHMIYACPGAGAGELLDLPGASQIPSIDCPCMARERNVKIVIMFQDMRKYMKFWFQCPQRKSFWNTATPIQERIARGCFARQRE